MWFATIVAGITVRVDTLGVTSIVRALNLRPKLYHRLLAHFHSIGVKLDRLAALWTQLVLRLFSSPVRANGRLVLVGDGIKAPKRGRKMPAVKLFASAIGIQHQARIHHGAFHAGCRPARTRGSERLLRTARGAYPRRPGMVQSRQAHLARQDARLARYPGPRGPFYFVADAYYAAGKMVSGLLKQGNHLVTRVKSNAVAYAPAPRKKGRRTRGRPKTYGKKIKLKSLLANVKSMQQVASPVYGERNVTLRYRVCDLLWRPAGRLVRFVVVVHPTRGSCILMCTDTSLSAVDIVRLYGLRFKIEHSFKQATRQIGSFAYHFWMKDMVPLRYHNGDQYLHRKIGRKRKIGAYHAFIQAAVVAQGLLQYLAVVAPKLVWDAFGSWLRTIRPGIPPSEFVVANALRQSLPDFLLGPAKTDSLTKFIADRRDTQNMRIFRLAG
jgi:hypothetical protein